MESHNRVIILEFNGIPGCGKTTTANLLFEKLRDLNYKVITFKELLNNEIKIKKINLIVDLFKISNLRFAYNIIKLCLYTKPIKFSRFKYAKTAYIYYYIMNHLQIEKKKYDFIICDQGLIQIILSIMYIDIFSKKLHVNKLIDKSLACFTNLYYINCIVDISTAKDRIRSRNLKQGRLDFIMDDDELLSALTAQIYNLEIIRNSVKDLFATHVIDLKMNCSPDENAEKIIKNIL